MNAGRTQTFGRVGLLFVLLMVMLLVSPTIHVPVSAQTPNLEKRELTIVVFCFYL